MLTDGTDVTMFTDNTIHFSQNNYLFTHYYRTIIEPKMIGPILSSNIQLSVAVSLSNHIKILRLRSGLIL